MRKQIRYAVVGLGHIAQVAVLPAFANARRNSKLAALVSGDPVKLDALGKRYDVKNLRSYEQLVEPAYEYAAALEHKLTVDGESRARRFARRDQFAPELLYFSDCVLQGRDPEPGPAEGLADVRAIRALYRSAQSGHAVALEPYEKRERPSLEQEIRRPPIEKPAVVHAQAPSGAN